MNVNFYFLDFKAVQKTYCSPRKLLANATMNSKDVRRKCSDDFSCAQFFQSGSNDKYYKCDAISVVKSSFVGSVLYPKGILQLKSYYTTKIIECVKIVISCKYVIEFQMDTFYQRKNFVHQENLQSIKR